MNELRQLRAMRQDAPTPDLATLNRPGVRLAGEIHSARHLRNLARGASGRSRLPRRFARVAPAGRILVAGGLAAAVLAVGTVVIGLGGSEECGSAACAPQARESTPPGSPEYANAAAFLTGAATSVGSRKPEAQQQPSDDDWFYVKLYDESGSATVQNWGDPASPRGETHAPDAEIKETPGYSEEWIRFDGEEIAHYAGDGELIREPSDRVIGDDNISRSPAEAWAYHESLPRDPDALLAKIYEEVKRIHPDDPWFHHPGPELNNGAVWLIGEVLGAGPTPPPDLQAALYRALAKVPGVEITTGIKDRAGRDGVLILHRHEDLYSSIVLDPETYAYLGQSFLPPKDGKVFLGESLLESGIVDEPGVRL